MFQSRPKIKKAGTDIQDRLLKRVYAFHETKWCYNLLRCIPVSDCFCLLQQQQVIQIIEEYMDFIRSLIVDFVLTIVNHFSGNFQTKS
jgi:hypothetical protein